uniref:GLOBIN domain-containing protein n=1 Tax=Panagrellus redivivus TaxID=6233 RepID=A0A7E5A293_PANRE
MSSDSFSCDATSDLTDVTILHWVPSQHETELMKRTFSYDFDFLYKVGASIFTYIFENHPKTKELFPSMIQYGDNWKHSKEFLLFSTKFAQVLSHAVKNVAQIDTITAPLYSIGAMHTDFEPRGFHARYWNMFVDAMGMTMRKTIEPMTTLSSGEKSEAVMVWRRLAHFVISHMKRGFNDRKNGMIK